MKSPQKRSYHQYCGLARALDVVGGRWTLLIVRELLLGPRRYSDFLAGLPGITTNMLAARLKEMEGHGLVERVLLPPPTPAKVYQLTAQGKELEPVVMALGRWGGRFMLGGPGEGDEVNIGWGLVSMKRRYVGPDEATVILNIDGRSFRVDASPKYVDIQEGAVTSAPVKASGDLRTFQRLLFLRESSAALEAQGALKVVGDQESWAAYLRAFDLVA